MKIESIEAIPSKGPLKRPGFGLKLDWDIVEKYRLNR